MTHPLASRAPLGALAAASALLASGFAQPANAWTCTPGNEVCVQVVTLQANLGTMAVDAYGIPQMASHYGILGLTGLDAYDAVDFILDWTLDPSLPYFDTVAFGVTIGTVPPSADLPSLMAHGQAPPILTDVQSDWEYGWAGGSDHWVPDVSYDYSGGTTVLWVVQEAITYDGYIYPEASYGTYVVLVPGPVGAGVVGVASAGSPDGSGLAGTTSLDMFAIGPVYDAPPAYGVEAGHLDDSDLALSGDPTVIVPCPPLHESFAMQVSLGVDSPCPPDADNPPACAGLVVITLGGCQGGDGQPGCSGGVIVALDGGCRGGVRS